MIFIYTVQPGDRAADLNYVSTGSLSLGATGALKAVSGVGVSLTLPGLVDAGTLGTLKDFKIDTTTPAAPASGGFTSPLSTSANIVMSWANSTDTPNNFRYHNVKLCAANDCSTSCIGLTTDLASPVTPAGINGSTYYGCVQGEDLAGNVTAWVPSVGTVKPTIESFLSKRGLSIAS
ncbi:MAG: hypothetical protein H7318_17410 [Oligoflexus sp.]|nr:hypothetical protein [Oligoflexus sp.]